MKYVIVLIVVVALGLIVFGLLRMVKANHAKQGNLGVNGGEHQDQFNPTTVIGGGPSLDSPTPTPPSTPTETTGPSESNSTNNFSPTPPLNSPDNTQSDVTMPSSVSSSGVPGGPTESSVNINPPSPTDSQLGSSSTPAPNPGQPTGSPTLEDQQTKDSASDNNTGPSV